MPSSQLLLTAADRSLILTGGRPDSESRALRRDVERGSLIRLVPGVAMDRSIWNTLTADERYMRLIIAIATTMGDGVVFSHRAAAALHGLPSLGGWPAHVDVTIDRASGGRSSGRIRRHGGDLPAADIVSIDGMLCTAVARTVIDVARARPFDEAVALADAALHRKRRPRLLALDELRAHAHRVAGSYGHRRVARVIAFATPLSDSVLESRSRVVIHEFGFPPPILQRAWHDFAGYIGETDFWWPDFRLCGEFDGLVKYLDRDLRRGRSPEEVLVEEKVREDRIRACTTGMVRWTADELAPPHGLVRKLLAAGLPMAT